MGDHGLNRTRFQRKKGVALAEVSADDTIERARLSNHTSAILREWSWSNDDHLSHVDAELGGHITLEARGAPTKTVGATFWSDWHWPPRDSAVHRI
jgi:hypothetical protein